MSLNSGKPVWVHGPATDVFAFGFAWVPLFALCVLAQLDNGAPVCDAHNFRACSPLMLWVFVLVNYVIRVHRHYTFGFVYGDQREFKRRKKLYTWLPICLLAAILPFALQSYYPAPLRSIMYGGLLALSAPSALWNAYHLLTQKYGILRGYASKLGYGDPKLEKSLLFSWAALVAAAMLFKYEHLIEPAIENWHYVRLRFIGPLVLAGKFLVIPAALAAAYFTIRWLAQEYRNFSRASIPKLVFAGSVALILLTFFHSLVTGYLVFGFSHAVEYVVFVNIFGLRRPTLSDWVKAPVILNTVMITGVVALYLALKEGPFGFVLAYTTFNSYLHFFYDGMIWKTRTWISPDDSEYSSQPVRA